MSQKGKQPDIEALVVAISEQEGVELQPGRRLVGGEQGAWLISDPEGHRYILKFDPDHSKLRQYQRGAETTRRLRSISYPAPRYLVTGAMDQGSYAVTEMLPGKPKRHPPRSSLPALVHLNKRQRGQAPAMNDGWTSVLVNSVLVGEDGYCVVETLRYYSNETASILSELQRIASASTDLVVPVDDIVHFDFHPENILFDGELISGVIDWEGTCTGDASFDLATLLFYCWDDEHARTTLKQDILQRSGPGALRLYLAHMILRQVDWSIRHHDEATVEHYLKRSQRVLSEKSLT